MKLKEPVSVSFAYDHEKGEIFPRWMIWSGKLRAVNKVGLHHTYKKGRTLYHVFSVTSNSTFFRLILNTDNLHWEVEQISDNLSS